MPSSNELISQLYAGYFNRAPDPAGLNYWVGHLNAGLSLTQIAQSFAVQPEATSLYGFLSDPASASRQAFLSSVYSNLFNRAPDAAGQAYWLAQLSNPAISVGRILSDILSGAQGNDALIATNKGNVGAFFASQFAANNTPFTLEAARSVLAKITENPASVATAVTTVNTTVNPPPPPVTNDSITLNVTATTSIDGGAGTDTLVLSGAAPAAITVNFGLADQFTMTGDVQTQTGFENVNAKAVTGFKVDVVTVAATTSVGLGTVTGATISGAATTLAIDASTLVDGGTVTLTGASMAPTVTGLKGDLTVDNAVAGNVAVTLAAVATSTVAFGTNLTGTHSVNADALTDGQVLTLTGSDAATVSLVGGDLTAGAYTGALTVTATTGTNVITTGSDADTINGGAGADTITGGAGADTTNGDAGNDVFKITGSGELVSGALIIDLINGGADTDDIELGNALVTLANTVSLSRITNVERITSVANGNAISLSFDDTVSSTGLTTVDLSGDTNAAGSNVVDLSDDTNAAATIAVTGSAGADTITGNGVANTITGGGGADTLIGGAGSDIYKYTATTDGSTTPGSGDLIATANFVTADDDFNFANVAFGSLGVGALTAAIDTAFNTNQATTLTDLGAKADSGVYRATFTGSIFDAAFYDALDAAMTGGTGTGAAFFIITNGTDSRILYDADTNATAAGSIVEIVRITGAAGLTVATADLVIV